MVEVRVHCLWHPRHYSTSTPRISGMRADLLQPATSSSESEGEEDAEELEVAGRMGGR